MVDRIAVSKTLENLEEKYGFKDLLIKEKEEGTLKLE